MTVGVGCYLQAKFAPHPMDKLMLVIHNKFGLSISISRILCETFAILMGFLLSGPVSYGTAIVVLFVGPCIQFSFKKMQKIYDAI
jgi:uncharacterized membrane protein YczE